MESDIALTEITVSPQNPNIRLKDLQLLSIHRLQESKDRPFKHGAFCIKSEVGAA